MIDERYRDSKSVRTYFYIYIFSRRIIHFYISHKPKTKKGQSCRHRDLSQILLLKPHLRVPLFLHSIALCVKKATRARMNMQRTRAATSITTLYGGRT